MKRYLHHAGYVLLIHFIVFGWLYAININAAHLSLKIWFWVGIIIAMLIVAMASWILAEAMYDLKDPEPEDEHGEYGD